MQCIRDAVVLVLLVAVFGCSNGGPLMAGSDAAPGADGAGGTGGAPMVDAKAPAGDLAAPADTAVAIGEDAGVAAPDAGQIADGPPVIGTACNTAPLGPTPLRRLTNVQYDRTLRDLLGVTGFGAKLPQEQLQDGFEDRADQQNVNPLLVAAWSQAADEAGASVVARLETFINCAPSAIDYACVRNFIVNFGGRAYRRPIGPAELDAHLSLYARVREVAEPADAVAAVARAMLQSPHFLYRPELSGNVTAGRMALSPWEVATRLSYFFWGTMPDSELFAAAAAGKLKGPEEIALQARRLLVDPRAREGVSDFFRQWLSIDEVLRVTKNPLVHPRFSPSLAASMREEGHRFVHHVMFERGARLGTLFTASDSILNSELGQLYGVAVPGPQWQRVDLTGAKRMGLLTQGWFLATHANQEHSSPTYRGKFVRERLLCQQVPPPPPNIDTTLPVIAGATTRERYAAHRRDPVCAGCHQLIDALGFPFESYDAIGAFRASENGKPIDSSGEIVGTDVDGQVSDALALSRRLAGSGQVRTCVASRWYQLSLGRPTNELDRCQVDELDRGLVASSGNLVDLMVAIAGSPSFRTRLASEVTGGTTTLPIIVDPGVARNVRKMILDLVSSQVVQLSQRHSAPGDRQRLDQHLAGLRELERRLQ